MMTKTEKCESCGRKPLDGCSRVDCSSRKIITACPPEGRARLGVITADDYAEWYMRGVRDADEV
jgi:hypothetical protein